MAATVPGALYAWWYNTQKLPELRAEYAAQVAAQERAAETATPTPTPAPTVRRGAIEIREGAGIAPVTPEATAPSADDTQSTAAATTTATTTADPTGIIIMPDASKPGPGTSIPTPGGDMEGEATATALEFALAYADGDSNGILGLLTDRGVDSFGQATTTAGQNFTGEVNVTRVDVADGRGTATATATGGATMQLELRFRDDGHGWAVDKVTFEDAS